MGAENLKTLVRYFPTGTAEGERDFLPSAFVKPAEFDEIVAPPPGSPRLLVGKKGCGKSALLEDLRVWAQTQAAPSLLLRPDDLVASIPMEATDLATIKGHAFDGFVRRIAAELAQAGDVKGRDDLRLYSEAVAGGERSPHPAQRFARLAMRLLGAFGQIDLEKLMPQQGRPSAQALAGSVRRKLARRGLRFYLLLDDTDQIAALDREEDLNRIWGLVLAARKLAQDIPEVVCLVTLRTEVWERLKSGRVSQRDQLDHFRPLVRDLIPTEKHLHKILEKRLRLACGEVGTVRSSNPFAPFFEGDAVAMPGSGELRPWPEALVHAARERPRDVIQLVQKLAQVALDGRRSVIDTDTVLRTLPAYSRERSEDLCTELNLVCPQLDQVVRSFAALAFECTAEHVHQHLVKLPSAFSLTLRNAVLRPNDRDQAFRLWALLFEAGFLQAKVPDARQPLGFRHVTFRHEPDLVEPVRWNDMQRAAWEVHPAYRPYLYQYKLDEEARRVAATAARTNAGRKKRRR